jgi:hypothetical protein
MPSLEIGRVIWDLTIEVLSTLYEDEDAHLVVFLPEGAGEREMERLHKTADEAQHGDLTRDWPLDSCRGLRDVSTA